MKFEKSQRLLEAEAEENSKAEVPEEEEKEFDWEQYIEDVTNGKYELDMERLADALDWVCMRNIENIQDSKYFQPINLLVLGEPGGGKTSIIKDWAKNRKIALKSLTGSELTDTMVQGLPFADTDIDTATGKEYRKQKFLPSTAFDELDDKKGRYSVLFLDELNRSWEEAEAAILSLIQDHEISDINYEGGKRHFDKFLFTVAACNPPETNKGTRQLSLALNTRFRYFYWDSDPKETRNFWDKEYEYRLEQAKAALDAGGKKSTYERKIKALNGKKAIIDALTDSELFVFSDGDEAGDAQKSGALVLNARTLASALEACNGTVGTIIGSNRRGGAKYTPGSFLDEFGYHCGTKYLDLVEEILAPVAEAQDAANGFQATVYDKFNRWRKMAKREGKIS